MWQYTNDIPWWVLYNTKVLFNVCRDDKQEKGKNKEVQFCKLIAIIIMIISFDFMQ